MSEASAIQVDPSAAVAVSNIHGVSPYVLVCDHASNHVPAGLGTMGLTEADMLRHIAWDPGAIEVSRHLAEALDAALVESRVSRLVIDCNRPLDAPDLVTPMSETTVIPANQALSEADRAARVAMSWTPFHAALDALVDDRLAAGRETRLVSIHSFNPVYRGVARPWHVGIIHDEDIRLAGPMVQALRRVPGAVVGVNEPYSPVDRVYYTLERHGRARGLACAMIEIRNDEIRDDAGQRRWADVLAGVLSRPAMAGGMPAAARRTG